MNAEEAKKWNEQIFKQAELESRIDELERALREIDEYCEPRTLLAGEAKAVTKKCRGIARAALFPEDSPDVGEEELKNV